MTKRKSLLPESLRGPCGYPAPVSTMTVPLSTPAWNDLMTFNGVFMTTDTASRVFVFCDGKWTPTAGVLQ